MPTGEPTVSKLKSEETWMHFVHTDPLAIGVAVFCLMYLTDAARRTLQP